MRIHGRGYLMARVGLLSLLISTATHATDYYVSTTGSDLAAGTIGAPFASLARAQQAASSGDNVYIRGGTYSNFTSANVAATDATYQYALNFNKSNINYIAYPGDSR